MLGRSITSIARRSVRSVPKSDLDREISAAQFQALYEHMPMVLTVNVVNSALVALVLASYMEQTRWWIFFGLVVALTGARAMGWRHYHNHRKGVEDKTRWAILATAGSGSRGFSGAGVALYCFRIILLSKLFWHL
jgi:hypothetical protein